MWHFTRLSFMRATLFLFLCRITHNFPTQRFIFFYFNNNSQTLNTMESKLLLEHWLISLVKLLSINQPWMMNYFNYSRNHLGKKNLNSNQVKSYLKLHFLIRKWDLLLALSQLDFFFFFTTTTTTTTTHCKFIVKCFNTKLGSTWLFKSS